MCLSRILTKLVIYFVFQSFAFTMLAGDTIPLKRNLSIDFSKTDLTDYNGWPTIYYNDFFKMNIEYTHTITPVFDVGGYVSFGEYYSWFKGWELSNLSPTLTAYYGVTAKIHLLPLVNVNRSRFDFYVQPRIGAVTFVCSDVKSKIEDALPMPGTCFEFSMKGGLAYYVTKRFGFFVEEEYSFFKYHNGFNTNFGCVFKF